MGDMFRFVPPCYQRLDGGYVAGLSVCFLVQDISCMGPQKRQ